LFQKRGPALRTFHPRRNFPLVLPEHNRRVRGHPAGTREELIPADFAVSKGGTGDKRRLLSGSVRPRAAAESFLAGRGAFRPRQKRSKRQAGHVRGKIFGGLAPDWRALFGREQNADSSNKYRGIRPDPPGYGRKKQKPDAPRGGVSPRVSRCFDAEGKKTAGVKGHRKKTSRLWPFELVRVFRAVFFRDIPEKF